MSGSAAVRAYGVLLITGLATPSSLLLAGAASATDPLVTAEPLPGACGVRLTTGSPSQHLVSLALEALDPTRTVTLEEPGEHELNSSAPLDLLAVTAPAEQVYRATVTVDGSTEPAVELRLPECSGEPGVGGPGAVPSPSASPSPSGSPSASPSASGSPTEVGSQPPSDSPSPSNSATPVASTTSAPATPAPPAGPAPAPSTPTSGAGTSGVVALSGAVSALIAPVEAAPAGAPAAAPAPVVAPVAGATVLRAAAPAPLAAALPDLELPPAAEVAAEPRAAAAPSVPVAADPLESGLPGLMLAVGSAAGALGIRLRRRT